LSQQLYGFYVSFSGEVTQNPINNVYALSTAGVTLSTAVLGANPRQAFQELRGMAFGPDGNFYVAQAWKGASAVMQFDGALSQGSYTMSFNENFVTASASAGLVHPYQPVFGPDGNLYVSSQDTNVVTVFYGPENSSAGQAGPDASSLPTGTFYPGTFVPAFSAAVGIPPNTSVPVADGGLTFLTTSSSTHSVRGLAFDSSGNLYVADEGNNRVAVFNSTGAVLGFITGSKSHTISEPVALCFDVAGETLYIASPGNNTIFTYDASGAGKSEFTAKLLISDASLDKLSGIAVDPSGNLYSCSRGDMTISIWTESNGAWSASSFAGPFTDSPEQIMPVYTPIVGQ